ncbi:MAG TPA: transcriptional regulator [Sphingomicrobium sp.]
MNIERGIGRHRVGSWDFLPDSGELRRRSDVRRLEPRAARVLDLLCRARGAVVSHEQLIREVWHGRSLSENSVAVVIGQLRKALDDDAREPRLIETIPKRGYRLIEQAREAAPDAELTTRRRKPLLLLFVAGISILLGVAIVWRTIEPLPAGRIVKVQDVANETGYGGYAPHARATSELIVDQLSRRGFDVRRGGKGGGPTLVSKLVMWNGEPYLGMTAVDERNGVLWSAMLKGGPAEVPRTVDGALDEFQAKFPAN